MASILTNSQIAARIETAFTMAEECGWDQHKLLSYIENTVSTELASRTDSGKRRYTQSQSGYAAGYEHALHARLMRERVEFCYMAPDGVIYSTHKGSIHRSTDEFFEAGLGHLLGGYPSAHVWKGTDKPFSTGGFALVRQTA